MRHACHTERSRSVGVPPRKASGSRFPLQVLGRITGLWAFRCNRSREMPAKFKQGVPSKTLVEADYIVTHISC
jgi:hypothetical protein